MGPPDGSHGTGRRPPGGDQPLIVAGFHRSGTSFAASLLHAAGLGIGDDLIGAFPSNRRGHFEDREIVAFHNALLSDNGLDWMVDSPMLPVVTEHRWSQLRSLIEHRRSRGPRWGFKDPRVCLFLPLWKHLLPEMRVLLVFRRWDACAASLQRRHADGLARGVGDLAAHRRVLNEPQLAMRMWATYNESLLQFANRFPDDTVAISFDTLRRGFPVTDALNRRWRLALGPVATTEVFDAGMTMANSSANPAADQVLARRLDRTEESLLRLESAFLEEGSDTHVR